MKSTQAESKVSPPETLMQPSAPEVLQWETLQIEGAIAQRAYELFVARNGEHGHDVEDWLQAESELLRPVSIAMSESPDRVSIRVNIPGFNQKELKVGIEPRSITIVGRRDPKSIESEDGRPSTASHVMSTIALRTEIETDGATVELESGVLKLELPKLDAVEAKAVAAGSD